MLPAEITARLGLTEKVQELISATQLPFVLAPLSKGLLDKSLTTFWGMYAGIQSTPKGLHHMVEAADLILDLGDHLNLSMNTGFWTARIPEQVHIHVYDNLVQINERTFVDVAMGDLLNRLITGASGWKASPMKPLPYEPEPLAAGHPPDPTSSAGFYPRRQRLLQSNDTLVGDSGSYSLAMAALRLSKGVDFESQLLWSSIGSGTPLAVGVAMAEPDRRAILVTGDEAH